MAKMTNARAYMRGLTSAAQSIRPRRMPKLFTAQCEHCGASVRFSRRVGRAWVKKHTQVCKKIQ